MSRKFVVLPGLALLLATAAIATLVMVPLQSARGLAVGAFVLVGPGAAVVALLRVRFFWTKLMIAIPLGLSIQAAIAGVALYTGLFAPQFIFLVTAGVTVVACAWAWQLERANVALEHHASRPRRRR
jgi:hypothetical protein